MGESNRGGWRNEVERARHALDANKAQLESAHDTGLASDKTLRSRGYDADPKGGGKTVPLQVAESGFWTEIPTRQRSRKKPPAA